MSSMFNWFKRSGHDLGLTAIGLQADGVSLARVERQGQGRPRLTACHFMPYESDDRSKQIARIASQYHLKHTRCTTVLDESNYQLLLTEAPDVKPDELKAAIRWRIKDLIGFHINDATLDIFDVPGVEGAARLREMYVVAVQNTIVQERVDLMEGAGVNLQIIDIPEMAQRNIAALLPADEKGVVMLSFQRDGGLLTLTRAGELFLSRPLNVGIDMLLRQEQQAGYFDHVVLEVQRSLDYYESHFRQAPIRDLVLAPAPGEIPGLIEHLGANLNVQISVLDFAMLMDSDVELPTGLQSSCLATIGAALRQEVKAL